jgi:hypothetical protein
LHLGQRFLTDAATFMISPYKQRPTRTVSAGRTIANTLA